MNSSSREKTLGEALLGLLKIAYAVCVPFLLIFGVITLFALSSNRAEANVGGLPLFSVIIWMAIIVPIALYLKGRKSRADQVKSILKSLKSDSFFQPEKGNETNSASSGKYFGIDARNGTLLYIHVIRRGQVDVVGMTMADWTQRELEDKKLRLYTKFVGLPCIEIASYESRRWYDTLGAMEHKRYNTPKPFGQYVSEHVGALERENNIHIPKLA